jgi:organic hydroperoxide reductase OsmC/OhrA
MIQYPLSFPVKVEAAGGIQNGWTSTASQGSELPCAIPPEFEGPGRGYSPEDYFALAIANCFVATFKVIAEKSKVGFEKIQVNGVLTADRNESGQPFMKSMKLEVQLDAGGGDPERLRRILEKTSQSCLVIHSVKTEVEFVFKINHSMA